MIKIKNGDICPITNTKITETYSKSKTLNYGLHIDDINLSISICSGCAIKIFEEDKNHEFKNYFRKYKGLLIGYLLKTKFEKINTKIIHFKSNKKNLEDNEIDLFLLVEKLKTDGKYPIHRKEKFDLILKSLYDSQNFEGDKVSIGRDITFWGNLFLQNFEELTFYLREFERNNLITIILDSKNNIDLIQFTGIGLEKIEKLELDSVENPDNKIMRKYEIALSFAGEQRQYVEKVAKHLQDLKVKTFYDNAEQVDLWGKNLYQHLNDVYKNKSIFCIVFVSKEYALKLWTKHELKSAQARAFKENKEYILPARFDNTELPGLDETMGYINLAETTPKELAELAFQKLKKS